MTQKEYCTNDKTYICSFSGGKDSVATYLYLTKELERVDIINNNNILNKLY